MRSISACNSSAEIGDADGPPLLASDSDSLVLSLLCLRHHLIQRRFRAGFPFGQIRWRQYTFFDPPLVRHAIGEREGFRLRRGSSSVNDRSAATDPTI